MYINYIHISEVGNFLATPLINLFTYYLNLLAITPNLQTKVMKLTGRSSLIPYLV